MTTTLYYYGSQGRGQQIRYALAEAGIAWEDDNSTYPPTPEAKARWTEAGGLNLTTNVPMLVHNGVAHTQSTAVLCYVARLGGLYPAGAEEAYAVDNMIAAVDDFRTVSYGIIFGANDAASVGAFGEKLDVHFANFERLLGKKDWFCGDSITVADLTAFDLFNNFGFNLLPSKAAKFPALVAFMERVKARPNIAAYMASDKFKSLRPFDSRE